MKQNKDKDLLARFLISKGQKTKPYFDVSEIENLLDYLDDMNNYTYHEDILILAKALHPDHSEIKIRECQYLIVKKRFQEAHEIAKTIKIKDDLIVDFIFIECFVGLKLISALAVYTEMLISEKSDEIYELYDFACETLANNEMTDEICDDLLSYTSRGLSLIPEHLGLNELYCSILEFQKKYEEAKVICNFLIDLDPYCGEYWSTMGRLNLFLHNYEEAIDACDYALLEDDFNSTIIIQKAYCYSMLGNYQEAINLYLGCMVGEAVKPANLELYIAECYIKMSDYKQAYHWLHELIYDENQTKESNVYINYINCCSELGYKEEELQIYQLVVDLYPNDLEVLYAKAFHYLNIGEDLRSIETLENIIETLKLNKNTRPEMWLDSYFKLGMLFFENGEYSRAYEYFESVKTERNDYPGINYFLAVCAFKLDECDCLIAAINNFTVDEAARFLDIFSLTDSFSELELEKINKALSKLKK